MLDAIPLLVWRRGADRTLVDCNRAYASALDTTADLVVAEGRELASGARPGECRHVVIGGSRRLVEIGEVPCSTGGTIGFACDRTDREAAEAELWRHIQRARRGARDHPRLRRHLRPRQAAQIF